MKTYPGSPVRYAVWRPQQQGHYIRRHADRHHVGEQARLIGGIYEEDAGFEPKVALHLLRFEDDDCRFYAPESDLVEVT